MRLRNVIETAVYAGAIEGHRLERRAILRLIAGQIRYYKLNPNAQETLRHLAKAIRARAQSKGKRR